MKKIVVLMAALLVLCVGFSAVSFAGTMTYTSAGEPIELVFEEDIDFLVKSDTEPVTFVVSTWDRSKVVFQKEIDLTDRVKE